MTAQISPRILLPQTKALTEKIRELEIKVAALEAEKVAKVTFSDFAAYQAPCFPCQKIVYFRKEHTLVHFGTKKITIICPSCHTNIPTTCVDYDQFLEKYKIQKI